jgi:signal transduction histidine kinase
MDDKNIEFLDSSIKDIEIKFNEKQISEIFSPLIKTAHDLVGAYGKIEIGVDDDEKNVTFFVKDNGDGISKEKQDQLFKKDDHNTSSGLMMSRQLVEEMGGKIWVESVSYLGTSFYFTIPKSE